MLALRVPPRNTGLTVLSEWATLPQSLYPVGRRWHFRTESELIAIGND